MKKFTALVAFDFSKSSSVVLEKAIDFISKMNGELHIVHVVEYSLFSKKIDLDSIKERGFLELNKSFNSIKKENYHCISGKIKVEVANAAKILNADVIIMGNSGETHFLSNLFIGSHTKEIVKHAQTSVLIMKSEHELRYKNILVLTDMSDESAVAIKKVAKIFADSTITLLNFFYLPLENISNRYGLKEEDVAEYQTSIVNESQKNINSFLDSLNLPKNLKISTSYRKSSLNPKLFNDEVSDINFDLLVIHAKESVSFYAYDVFEQSLVDVFIIK